MAPAVASCPHCAAVLDPPDVPICVSCGFNLRARHPRAVGGGERTSPADPAELLGLYDRGALTPLELQSRLVQAAATRPPEEIAPLLPDELLAELRGATDAPPDSPDGVLWGGSICAGPEHDWEGHQREQRRLWYDGAWRWNAYFRGKQA